jgi:hypothetical protein
MPANWPQNDSENVSKNACKMLTKTTGKMATKCRRIVALKWPQNGLGFFGQLNGKYIFSLCHVAQGILDKLTHTLSLALLLRFCSKLRKCKRSFRLTLKTSGYCHKTFCPSVKYL